MSYGSEEFSVLVGKVFTEIKVSEYKDKVTFICRDGGVFEMYHKQDCCESVEIEDICGDLTDLIDSPILVAEESWKTEAEDEAEDEESYTWTFYKLDTIKGGVTIRWFGSSNGYYSESVDLFKVSKQGD